MIARGNNFMVRSYWLPNYTWSVVICGHCRPDPLISVCNGSQAVLKTMFEIGLGFGGEQGLVNEIKDQRSVNGKLIQSLLGTWVA